MILRSHFSTTKMAISEAEMSLLGDKDGHIPQADLIKARASLVNAVEALDRTCHKHGYMAKPPRADI